MITVFFPLVRVSTRVETDRCRQRWISSGSLTLPACVYTKPKYWDKEYKAYNVRSDAKVSDVSKYPSVYTHVSKYVEVAVGSVLDTLG